MLIHALNASRNAQKWSPGRRQSSESLSSSTLRPLFPGSCWQTICCVPIVMPQCVVYVSTILRKAMNFDREPTSTSDSRVVRVTYWTTATKGSERKASMYRPAEARFMLPTPLADVNQTEGEWSKAYLRMLQKE